MSPSLYLLHKKPEFMQDCCDLINEEWKRSDTARMRSFQNSCDFLPVNIILLEDEKTLLGHLKLSKIPALPNACFVESVVIRRNLRGKGYGTKIMRMSEEYCENCLKLNEIYLSTRGQEEFYRKLGYEECAPISIYGNPSLNSAFSHCSDINVVKTDKIYMKKKLRAVKE